MESIITRQSFLLRGNFSMGMQGVICGETAERGKRVPLAAIRVWNAGHGLWRDGGKCEKSGYGGDF